MLFGIKCPYSLGQKLTLEDAFDFVSDLDFSHVDLGGLYIKETSRTTEFENRFLEVSQNYDLSHSFHLAYRECVICSSDRSIRQEAVQEYFRALDIAAGVNSKFVSMHPIYRYYRVEMKKLALEVFRDLTDYAQEVGVPIAVENQIYPGFNTGLYPGSFDEFSSLFNDIREVNLLLDTGHAFVEGGDDCIKAYINQFSDRLAGVHVSDNNGQEDEHLPLGEGKISLQEMVECFRDQGFSGPFIIETFKKDGFQKSREEIMGPYSKGAQATSFP